MKHLNLMSLQPALAQSTKQTTKEVVGTYKVALIDRLAQTAQSAPWGVKFPSDGD